MGKFKDNLQLYLNKSLKAGDKHYEVRIKENLISTHSELAILIMTFNSFQIDI
jgi:hypothetical protein